MIVFQGNLFNSDINNSLVKFINNITLYQLKTLIKKIIDYKYYMDIDLDDVHDPLFLISIVEYKYRENDIGVINNLIGTAFSIDTINMYINVNKNKTITFPLQIINKYDYLIMTYKRQKHRDFIRRWKEAIYKPKSKYFYKIKDNFEKLKIFPNFSRLYPRIF